MTMRKMPMLTGSAAILSLCFVPAVKGQTAVAPQSANLRVLLPTAKAQLKIENRLTQQTGTTRLFVTPPLENTQRYHYTLTAIIRPNNYTTITRVREVPIRAGDDLTVDLRQADKDHPDDILVRYVPTPPEVVKAMLRLAGVGTDDVVYDLGCGDGRIVIAAVRDFGAKHGVGVDIDPQRIRESRASAQESNVQGKVEFRQGDVLAIKDLADATVVMLYMGEELNLRLRPILQKLLKPGTRIVSHRFTMGDWKPHKTETLTDAEGEHYLIHLWKIGETPQR
jgi:uncharacterized protein (TIGR03000 family)